jgi:malonyl-CoA O-methyltransferase
MFDSADFVHAVTRDGLLERTQPLAIEPASILDLGAATGTAAAALEKRFRGAHLVSLDLSRNMLRQARRKRGWLSRRRAFYVQAEASHLPFPDQSIDMVFSNLLLPFVDRPENVFAEVSRVLREDGVFAFATLGPDSLQEMREAWRHVDSGVHVTDFPDMHDIGDALVKSGLRDPVLDVDRLVVQYEDPGRLFTDLGHVGARNTFEHRAGTLMGKRRFADMRAALIGASAEGKIRLDLELVYGHCWGGGSRRDPTNFTIDASHIPRRRG